MRTTIFEVGYMKKILALLLAMVMCFCVVSAMAEEAPAEAVEIPVVEGGTWVPFTDYGFQICLPSDWNVMEITEEQTASGIIFSCANPEATRSFTVAYSEFEAATDIQTIAEGLATTYPEVQLMTINGMDFVTYSVTENDVVGIATLGGSGIGMYQFVFYPASDTDYGTLALQIAASITAIEE